MKNLIVSTVGTSFITNQASKEERALLNQYSNCSAYDYPENVKELIDSFVPKCLEKLGSSDNKSIRRLSAELNGIYGFYNENLSNRKNDIHFLISTDTYQGIKSAEVVRDFIENKEIPCGIFIPQKLSTKNKYDFSEGIKDLLKWFDETIYGYKNNGYQIIFNLTGGFKSLQGYLNTIAMFYADKIIYIFESNQAELIEIPRLPIKVDTEPFEKNKVNLLLLNADRVSNPNDFNCLPEAAFDLIDGDLILSVWGEIIWNKIKYDLFTELPGLPFIAYHSKFQKQFSGLVDKNFKIKLVETVAKVSVLLERSDGSTTELSKGGIRFSPLESQSFEGKILYHFRTDRGIRINCIKKESGLLLTEFGTHDQTQ